MESLRLRDDWRDSSALFVNDTKVPSMVLMGGHELTHLVS